jgi:hypothetical protein
MLMPRWEQPLPKEKNLQRDQSVSEMTEDVLMRQAWALADRSGQSLEDARRAVAGTEAGRQLRDLANSEHRHEKAQAWQASVFWDRAEERLMHQIGSEALSRFVAERPVVGSREVLGFPRSSGHVHLTRRWLP